MELQLSYDQAAIIPILGNVCWRATHWQVRTDCNYSHSRECMIMRDSACRRGRTAGIPTSGNDTSPSAIQGQVR